MYGKKPAIKFFTALYWIKSSIKGGHVVIARGQDNETKFGK